MQHISTGNSRVQDGVSSSYIESLHDSIASERAKPRRDNRANAYNNRRRSALKQYGDCFTVKHYLKKPDDFIIKLSESEARYPDLQFNLNVNVQEACNSDYRKLRSLLIWYLHLEESWLDFYFDESFGKLLSPENMLIVTTSTKGEKISTLRPERQIKFLKRAKVDKITKERIPETEVYGYKSLEQPIKLFKETNPYVRYKDRGSRFLECIVIFQQYLILGRQATLELLHQVYDQENIQRWKSNGEKIISGYRIVRIPSYSKKDKQRKRGYRNTSSSNKITKNQEVKVMQSEESIELEKTLQRIKLKQAQLFEQRLDNYLQLCSEELSKVEKRQAFQGLLAPITNIAPVEHQPENMNKEEDLPNEGKH